MRDLVSSSGHFYFYLDPYEYAGSNDQQKALDAKVKELSKKPSIVMRCAELAADGIWPRVVVTSEAGHYELSVFVEFSKRGQTLLRGTGVGWSTIIRSARHILRSAYWLLALPLVVVILFDRLYKKGWVTTSVGLGLVFAVSALSVWFIRKRV